jgi:quercetin dioxygenase-like cupin family protein
MDSTLTGPPVLVSREELNAMAWEPDPRLGAGISHKLLWHSGDSVGGVMRIEPGGCLAAHTHRRAHHHLWVINGSAIVLGRQLGAGSYIHVPAGVEHTIASPTGCQFLYFYLDND